MGIPLFLNGPGVRGRVIGGRHSVPESKLSDRYERLGQHVVNAVPLATECAFWDNSTNPVLTKMNSFRFGLLDCPKHSHVIECSFDATSSGALCRLF